MRIKKEPLCQSNKCFCQPMQKTDEIVSRQQDRHSHTNEIRKKKIMHYILRMIFCLQLKECGY